MKRRWVFNGIAIPAEPKLLVSLILTSRRDIRFWSAEALTELYKSAFETAIEMAQEARTTSKGAEKAHYTRFINSAKRGKFNHLPDEREQLLKRIYEEVLSDEGMGLLRGFGVGNMFGDILVGDPERQSIYQMTHKPKQRSLIMASKKDTLMGAAKELKEVLSLVAETKKGEVELSSEMTVGQLTDYIKAAAKSIEPEDELSAETKKIVEQLSGADEAVAPAEKSKAKKPAESKATNDKKEPAPAVDAELIEQVKATGKLFDLKGLANDNEVFKSLRKSLEDYKGLQGTKDLKAAMLKKLGVKPQLKAEKEKPARVKKESLSARFIEELEKGPKTMAEIRKAKWNNGGRTFYDVFNALVKEGRAKKDGDKMILKRSA